jgi:hypothetical protein
MDAATAIDPIVATLRIVLCGLRGALGAWGLEAALAVAMHRRIGMILGRVERMLVRFRAGRLWQVTERTKRVGAIRHRRIDTLPRRFGWMVRAGGHRAAGLGSQLQSVLETPEMTELLAASPAAVRLLRPLCRALAVDLPIMRPPPREAATERPPRRRKPRPATPPFRIPLPRGVLSAARRQGFGRLCDADAE